MSKKERNVVRRWPNLPRILEFDLKRLEYVLQVDPTKPFYWTRKETRIAHSGPYGLQEFKTIEAKYELTREEKERLKRHAVFQLYECLADTPAAPIAKKMIKVYPLNPNPDHKK